MLKRRDILSLIKRTIDSKITEYPTQATIKVVDGNLADIQLPGHTTNLKNCRIVGDPTEISVGMEVDIKWVDYNGTKRPVIMGGGASGTGLSASGLTTVITDNVTIEYSDDGLRVKPGGIGLTHLNFVPAMSDHKHDISEWMKGWAVTDDGVLWSGDVSLNPLGEITLGRDPDIVKLSTQDDTYRIWAGALAPASAPFSVSKTGHLISSSADIAGWEITATEIKKTGIVLDSSADTIFVGATEPNIELNGPGKIIKSSSFESGVTGFGLYALDGDAEFMNVVVRGSLRASVFNIGEITATAGSQGVFKSAAEVYEDVEVLDDGQAFTLKAKNSDVTPGAAMFADKDVLRIKAWTGAELADVWLTVRTTPTEYTGYSEYNCLVESGGGTFLKKGMAIVDYGGTGNGFIIQSADGTVGYSANISIADFTTGVPLTWSISVGGGGYAVNDILTVSDGDFQFQLKVLTLGAGDGVATVQAVADQGGLNYITAERSTSVVPAGGTGCKILIESIDGPWGGTQRLMTRIGNMRGSYGAGSYERYGFGVGDFDSGNYMSYNAETAGRFIIRASDGSITLGSAGLICRTAAGGAYTVQIDTDGDAFFGSNIGSPASTAFAIFANAQTYNTEGMGAGDVLFGDNTNLKANIMWDKSAGLIRFRAGKVTQAYIDTDGTITAGAGDVKLNTDGIKIVADTSGVYPAIANRIAWEDGTSEVSYLATTVYSGSAYTRLWSDTQTRNLHNYLLIGNKGKSGYFNKTTIAVWNTEDPGSAWISLEWDTASNAYFINMDADSTSIWGGLHIKSGDIYVPAGKLLVGNATSGPVFGDIGYSSNLRPYRNNTHYTAYAYVPLATMIHGVNYWATAKTGAAGNYRTVTTEWPGLPANVKAIVLRIHARDSASYPQTGLYFQVGPSNSVDHYDHLAVHPGGDNVHSVAQGVVTVTSGTVYIRYQASGTLTLDTWLGCVGYYI